MMKIQNEARPHFSNSQLTTYLNCPMAYYLQYEIGIPWKQTPSAVAFGACIHRAIEIMSVCLQQGREPTQDDVVGTFNRDWADKIESENIVWRKPEEPAQLLIKGQDLLELYYKRFHERGYTAVELGFRLPILDPQTGLFVESHDLVGKFDAIEDGGTLVEIKTASRMPNKTQVHSDLQITLYSWAYRLLYGKPEDKILAVYLIKTKEPKIEVIETHRGEEDHTKLICLIEQVIRAIDQRLFYPNPVGGFGCGYCNYTLECKEQWPL